MNHKAAHTFARRELREICINVRERLQNIKPDDDGFNEGYWIGCFIGEIDALFSCGVLTKKGRDNLCNWMKNCQDL